MRIRMVNSFSQYKNTQGEYCPTPIIVVGGKWIANLGFKPGDKVKLCGKPGLVVVKLLKQE